MKKNNHLSIYELSKQLGKNEEIHGQNEMRTGQGFMSQVSISQPRKGQHLMPHYQSGSFGAQG